MGLFVSNLILGISLAAPIGPASAAIIQAGLAGGFRRAFLTGVGVTLADTTYLLIAFFGLSGLLENSGLQALVLAMGALVLVTLGLRSIRSGGRQLQAQASLGRARHPLLVGYLVNISNPLAIVWWVGIFGALLSVDAGQSPRWQVLINSSGILLGIWMWHSTLSAITHWGRQILSQRVARWISIGAGIVLMLFGVRFAVQAYQLFGA